MGFDNYVGQTDIVEQLKISINAAKKNERALEHCLFLGPPGLGKSTVSEIVAAEMGYNVVHINPFMVKDPTQLIKVLLNVKDNTILFIDEIHELSRDASEVLYPLMQDGKIHYTFNSQDIEIGFKNITVIGATTDYSLLMKPLVDRFTYKFYFELYTPSELSLIAYKYALDSGFPELCPYTDIIALKAKGTPRIAKSLVKLVKDDFDYFNDIDLKRVFKRNRIYDHGFDIVDKKIIEATNSETPVGLGLIASYVGEDAATIIGREKYLISLGFLQRTPRGRILTDQGKEWARSIELIGV